MLDKKKLKRFFGIGNFKWSACRPESARNHRYFDCKLLGMLNTNYFCTLPNLALQTEILEPIWDRKSLIWDRKFPIPLSSHFWHIIDRWKFWNIFLMFFIIQLCFSIVCEGFGWKISKSMFLNCDVLTYPFKAFWKTLSKNRDLEN